ncbi:hypothetical protein ILUMI_26315 [Ignelater luminosus]|uniref:Uncharacterized protein n=1 Tax=Ignelater luminosus TaxID=2038154 RepID=A0A8K0C882_IGNLU|nr:hypothetical protein ILUMI_26315 [Ignelater luminosus]
MGRPQKDMEAIPKFFQLSVSKKDPVTLMLQTAKQIEEDNFGDNTTMASFASISKDTKNLDDWENGLFCRHGDRTEQIIISVNYCNIVYDNCRTAFGVRLHEHTMQRKNSSQFISYRYQLSSPLLDAKYKTIAESVNERICAALYMLVQLDGWSKIKYEPVIPRIIDTGTNKHAGEFVADIIRKPYIGLNWNRLNNCCFNE